ncbi:SapC family protein [Roseateles sp.]|uniref:SapC family protein n=1 Tax=Roseateles sp. TaxID=1971397 RepID=UPI0032675F39
MTDSALPLFYKTPRVLHPGAHGHHSLAAKASYRFAAQTNAVPVVADEMMLAGRHYPLVFSDDARPYPVAVLGLRAQQNLFVDAGGQWRPGVYVPAYLRRYPFIFLENAASQELTLCVDEAAESLLAGRDNPLFDPSGEPTPLTVSALALCRDYQSQHLATAEYARAVVAADLLVEHRADVSLRDGRVMSLSGFKVIDQARFMNLPDETFLAWRRKGWLALVHWHFFSIGAWSTLIDAAAAQA